MEEFKGTKEPWEICQVSLYRGEEMIKDSKGKYIASISNRDTVVESGSNAQLIAAAPDLLEALRDAVQEIRHYHTGPNVVVERAESAIKKALGK